jgi:hypothetical protein
MYMPLPSRRFSAITVTGLLAIAGWFVYLSIVNSGHPGNYYAFRHSAAGFVYPSSEVATWCTAIAVDALLAASLVWRSPTPRALAAMLGLLCGLGLVMFGVMAMHAPPYYGAHLAFLFFAGVWLLGAAVVGGLLRLAAAGERAEVPAPLPAASLIERKSPDAG